LRDTPVSSGDGAERKGEEALCRKSRRKKEVFANFARLLRGLCGKKRLTAKAAMKVR
jgi:hypothetical protein